MCDDIKTTAGVMNRNASYSREYSPITLNSEWPEMGRLIFLVSCSTLGTIVNGFFISSFFVESTLRKAGNVFLGCVGLADILLTGVVIPTCAVVLLSRQWDIEPVCNVLQFITEFSTYSYNLFFMMVGIENVIKYYNEDKSNRLFRRKRVGVIAVIILFICFVTAGVGTLQELDYDYCSRAHFGNIYFRVGTGIFFQFVPFMITIVSLLIACVLIRRKVRNPYQHKRTHSSDPDFRDEVINLASYVVFVATWIPYLTIVNKYPETCDPKYYHFAWIGLSRSVLSKLMYAVMSCKFRRAFAHIFNYCCCKNTLNSNYSSRHRRALDCRPMITDVKVHIMHQAIGVNTPSRFSTIPREIQEL